MRFAISIIAPMKPRILRSNGPLPLLMLSMLLGTLPSRAFAEWPRLSNDPKKYELRVTYTSGEQKTFAVGEGFLAVNMGKSKWKCTVGPDGNGAGQKVISCTLKNGKGGGVMAASVCEMGVPNFVQLHVQSPGEALATVLELRCNLPMN